MKQRLRDRWRQDLQRDPDRLLLIDAATGKRITRGDLARKVAECAAALPATVRHRPVAFALANGVDWLARFIALLEAEAVPTPLDPTEPVEQLQAVAAHLGGFAWTGDELTTNPGRTRRRPTEACLIKLTSGSSGRPRALTFTDAQMEADGRQVCATMGLGPDDLNLAVIPFGHSYGLGNLVMPLLIQGTPVLLPRAPLPRLLAEDCATWRPTVFPAVPALLRLLSTADEPPAGFTSLRTIISAGAPLPVETAQRFHERFGRKVHGFYGSSETGGITYDRTGEATLEGRSVGTPLQGVKLGWTRRGRFQVTSDAVYTIGNRRRDAAGRGSHCPADCAALNAWGELVLQGRSGRLVKVSGRRLDLGELEQRLREISGVQEAYAIAHPTRPDTLAAALQTERGDRELRAELGRRLPPWKIPRRLLLLTEFPLTARGKPDTRSLTRQLQSE